MIQIPPKLIETWGTDCSCFDLISRALCFIPLQQLGSLGKEMQQKHMLRQNALEKMALENILNTFDCSIVGNNAKNTTKVFWPKRRLFRKSFCTLIYWLVGWLKVLFGMASLYMWKTIWVAGRKKMSVTKFFCFILINISTETYGYQRINKSLLESCLNQIMEQIWIYYKLNGFNFTNSHIITSIF